MLGGTWGSPLGKQTGPAATRCAPAGTNANAISSPVNGRETVVPAALQRDHAPLPLPPTASPSTLPSSATKAQERRARNPQQQQTPQQQQPQRESSSLASHPQPLSLQLPKRAAAANGSPSLSGGSGGVASPATPRRQNPLLADGARVPLERPPPPQRKSHLQVNALLSRAAPTTPRKDELLRPGEKSTPQETGPATPRASSAATSPKYAHQQHPHRPPHAAPTATRHDAARASVAEQEEEDDGYYFIMNDSDEEEEQHGTAGARLRGGEETSAGGADEDVENSEAYDSSLNSSFSGTRASGTSPNLAAIRASVSRETVGSSSRRATADAARERVNGGARGQQGALAAAPVARGAEFALEEDDEGGDDDDTEFDVGSDYDEEDEEMAVQRYMDMGTTHSRAMSSVAAASEEEADFASFDGPSVRRSKGSPLRASLPISPAGAAVPVSPALLNVPTNSSRGVEPNASAETTSHVANPGESVGGGGRRVSVWKQRPTTPLSQPPPPHLSPPSLAMAQPAGVARSIPQGQTPSASLRNSPMGAPQQHSPPPAAMRPHAASTPGNQAFVQQQCTMGHVPAIPSSRGSPPASSVLPSSTAPVRAAAGAPSHARAPVSPSRSPAAPPAATTAAAGAPASGASRSPPSRLVPAFSRPQGTALPATPDVPALSACRSLSLYDAFFLNESKTCWVVDDHVLAKCLEYVRLMGYQHPMLRRDRAMGNVNSLWSSSAPIPTPLVRAVPEEQAGKPGKDGVVPPTFRLKQLPPVCLADKLHVSSLFLSYAEAMRWINEQEYVIGTLLMCCARADSAAPKRGSVGGGRKKGAAVGDEEGGRHTAGEGNAGEASASGSLPGAHGATPRAPPSPSSGRPPVPVIPPSLHPIQWAAQHILTNFPHWGDFESFARVWEVQTRLTLFTASPTHQRVFHSRDDELTFHSDFEGGNLFFVEKAAESYVYYIWLEPDEGSDKRIWFRFAVAGMREGRTLRIRLMNAAPQTRLYRENGMSPVFRDGNAVPNWAPVDQCSFRTVNGDQDGEVSFAITARSSTDAIQVAFCAPYTYADLLCHFCHWHALVRASVCGIRFEERVLCRTPDGRKQHLLIITSPTSNIKQRVKAKAGKAGAAGEAAGARKRPPPLCTADPSESALGGGVSVSIPVGAGGGKKKTADGPGVVRGPYANFGSGKKVILVSSRVHPGEVTASHATHGLISFLLSADPRAIQLREHFLFFIVPMLNPDGVSRGHSRLDQFGNNLNRCYNTPDPDTMPTVYALRKVFEHLQQTFRERFIMYLDFHSHASQSSGFMFGNHLPPSVHHWNLVFPKIVELHARESFSFNLCRFGRVHMVTKDGASRVLFGESLIHSYTVELPYFTNRALYGDTFLAFNNGGGVVDDDAATLAGGPLSSFSALSAVTAAATTAPGSGYGEDGGGCLRGRSASRTKLGSQKAKGRSTSEAAGARSGGAAAGRSRNGKCGGVARGFSVGPGERGGASGASNSNFNGGGAGATASYDVHRRFDSPENGTDAAGSSPASASGSALPLSRKALRQLVYLPDQQSAAVQPISLPSVLVQSAAVGRACVFAVLDYCAAGTRLSPELTTYGGMERVLVEVKRAMELQARTKKRRAGRRTRPSPAVPEPPQTYAQLQQQMQSPHPQRQPTPPAQGPPVKDEFASQPIFRQY